jgi:four helix bundle protein
MQDYEKLIVWQHAHRVAADVQQATMKIARQDNAGLISQMRRAAQSVPANIAEGASKESAREFARFLQIAAGSAAELHYHLRFAMDSNAIVRAPAEALLAETTRVRKMLFVLLRRVRAAAGPADQSPTTNSPRRQTLNHRPETTDD